MRTFGTSTLHVAAFAVGALAAWGAWQRDREATDARPAPGATCLARIDSANRVGNDGPPTARLLALSESRSECAADATYVEQLIREMLQFQPIDSARALLAEGSEPAGRDTRVFVPAERDAVLGWIDLAESQVAFGEGRVPNAERLRAEAVGRATRLSAAWPEWAPPVRQLLEADQSAVAPAGAGRPDRLKTLRAARTRVMSGAFVRNMTSPLYALYTGLVMLLGAVSALFAVRHWMDHRARTATATVPIESLPVDDGVEHQVAVRGTLKPRPGKSGLVAPYSKRPAPWFRDVVNFSSRNRRTTVSDTPFVVADAGGQLIIDPTGFEIVSTHQQITLGGVHGSHRWKPRLETLLAEGDLVYAHGLLRRDPDKGNDAVLTADRYGRHMISNIPPEILRARASWLLAVGLRVLVACTALAVGSDAARRTVNVPGTLT